MANVVHVDSLFADWLVRRVVRLLENIRLKLVLSQTIGVLLHRVVGLGETVLGIPASVRSHINSLLGFVELLESRILEVRVLMSEHIRAELLGFSFLAVDMIVRSHVMTSLILVDVGLIGVSPVSLRGHKGTVALLAGVHSLLSVQLSHLAILSRLVRDDASGGLALQHSSHVGLLLPSVSLLIVTIETATASVASLQILSSRRRRFRTRKHFALPIMLLASSNGVMHHTVTLLVGSSIVSEHVGACKRSGLTLTKSCIGARESRALHNFALSLGTEDVRVLIRLARGRRLHRVTLELTFTDSVLVVLKSLGVFARLLEVNVR